jgi:hypothetical protein
LRRLDISWARRSEARAGESGRPDIVSARDASDVRRSGVRARAGERNDLSAPPRLRSVDIARERSSSELRPVPPLAGDANRPPPLPGDRPPLMAAARSRSEAIEPRPPGNASRRAR